MFSWTFITVALQILFEFLLCSFLLGNRIAGSPWATGWDVFDRYDEQQSEAFDLSAEEDYLLVGEFKEGGGEDYIQVWPLFSPLSLGRLLSLSVSLTHTHKTGWSSNA